MEGANSTAKRYPYRSNGGDFTLGSLPPAARTPPETERPRPDNSSTPKARSSEKRAQDGSENDSEDSDVIEIFRGNNTSRRTAKKKPSLSEMLEQLKLASSELSHLERGNGARRGNPLFNDMDESMSLLRSLVSDSGSLSSDRKRRGGAKGWKPLHYACQSGNIAIIKSLLSGGADIHSRDEDGWTPLHFAARHDSPDGIDTLLSWGADVNAEAGDGLTPLPIAILRDLPKNVESLVRAKADINRKYTGQAPIHNAVWKGNLAIVELLLAAGADINAADKDLDSPLHLAAIKGFTEIVRALLVAGADIEARNDRLRTPIYPAVIYHHFDIIDMLTEAGAELHVLDKRGNTPLHAACMEDNVPVVKKLLEMGADVNAETTDGEFITPLHLAAQRAEPDILILLLEHGANAL